MWCPCILLSRTTSRHHCSIDSIISLIPIIVRDNPQLWNHPTSPLVSISAPIDLVNGHGLNSTRWNGLGANTFFILVSVFILMEDC